MVQVTVRSTAGEKRKGGLARRRQRTPSEQSASKVKGTTSHPFQRDILLRLFLPAGVTLSQRLSPSPLLVIVRANNGFARACMSREKVKQPCRGDPFVFVGVHSEYTHTHTTYERVEEDGPTRRRKVRVSPAVLSSLTENARVFLSFFSFFLRRKKNITREEML